jgi:hypothetical protein
MMTVTRKFVPEWIPRIATDTAWRWPGSSRRRRGAVAGLTDDEIAAAIDIQWRV